MFRLPYQARKAEEKGSEARSCVPRKVNAVQIGVFDYCLHVAMAAAGDPSPTAQAIEGARGETPRFSWGASSASPRNARRP